MMKVSNIFWTVDIYIMNNKIIFLDVDGVLNSAEFSRWLWDNHEKKYRGYEMLDQRAILCLQDIVFVTGAKIVLSSSWRISSLRTKQLEEQLLPYGLEIIDRTISDASGGRGEEVKEWLSRHPEVSHFVILDDDDDFKDEELKKHFVQTTFYRGLLEEHVDKAIEILSN